MSQIIKFIFGFLIASSFFFELYTCRRSNIFSNLEKYVTEASSDNYDPELEDKVLYMKSNSPKYKFISDEDFLISQECGQLIRKVEYCQWKEISQSNTYERDGRTETNYTYDYYKVWSSTQINSLFFNSLRYHNPSVPEIPTFTFNQPMTIGVYTVDNSIQYHGSKQIFYPDDFQINNFLKSSMARAFKYHGRGVFYSEYQNGFIENALNILTFFDLEHKNDIQWCTPGDRRVWFEYWAPSTVTAVGLMNNHVLESYEFEGFSIGAVQTGEVSLNSILTSNTSMFPTIMKWLFRSGMVIYLAFLFNEENQIPSFQLIMAIIVIVFGNMTMFVDQFKSKLLMGIFSVFIGFISLMVDLMSESHGSSGYYK